MHRLLRLLEIRALHVTLVSVRHFPVFALVYHGNMRVSVPLTERVHPVGKQDSAARRG